MKKLIYLSLIAFIALTGCKGTSFTTQRYTNYKHTVKKGHAEEGVVVTKVKSIPAIEKEIVTPQQSKEVLVCSASQSKSESTFRSVYPIYKTKTMIENGLLKGYSENTSLVKHEAKNYRTKKTANERSEAAKGLIEGVLGLVVFIIVLVIVIVLIIFLVTVLL